MLNYWSSFVFPWLMALWLLLTAARLCRWRFRGWKSLVAWGVLVAALLLVPVRMVSIGRWPGVLNFQASVPLTGLLLGGVWRLATGREIFRPNERRAAWCFGLVSGVMLYPSALGVGDLDVYQWGWGLSPLQPGVAAVAIALALAGNRFAWLLILSLWAWDARAFESPNFWDYLTDPVFAFAAFVVIASTVVKKIFRRSRDPIA